MAKDDKATVNTVVPDGGVTTAEDAQKQAEQAVKLGDENVNKTGENIDGRKPDESEKPRPAVNRPTVPDVADETDESVSGPKLQDKSGMKYYVNRYFPSGSVLVRDPDEEDKTVFETLRFTSYYDMWKGDQVRVGYLATDNKNAFKILEEDENVEEISFSEYKLAMQGDNKRNKPLVRAPIAAS